MNAAGPRIADAQRAQLRARLERRAGELRGEIAAALRASENAEPAPGSESDTRLSEAGRDAQELERVTEALSRIGSEGFGRCADCDQPIAWARLEAEPHALRCVECEALRERRSPSPHASL